MDSTTVGLQLTLYGMGLVFLLLALLAGGIALLLRFDRAEPARANAPTEIDSDLLAAITVAVATHIAVRRKEAAPAMRAHQPGTQPSRWLGVGRARQNFSWQPGRRNR
jgi:Na+-transporting methylmalonyl-CoA/oxaloacetate decarboxylase gamma subunit